MPKAANNTRLHQSSLQAGMAAPWFEGTDQSGNIVNLNSFQGKKLLLYFYPKNGTGPCNAQACNLRDNFSGFVTKDVEILGVSTNNKIPAGKFALQHQLPFRLIEDTDLKIIKAYEVWGQKTIAGRIFEGIVRTSFIIENGIIKAVIKNINTQEHSQQIFEIIS